MPTSGNPYQSRKDILVTAAPPPWHVNYLLTIDKGLHPALYFIVYIYSLPKSACKDDIFLLHPCLAVADLILISGTLLVHQISIYKNTFEKKFNKTLQKLVFTRYDLINGADRLSKCS